MTRGINCVFRIQKQMSLMTSFYVLFKRKKNRLQKPHATATKSQFIGQQVLYIKPKKRFKRQQQQKCSEKIVVTCSNLFVSTCEIADFQFRFLIEIHFDIFIYSQFLIYQTELPKKHNTTINTVCKNGHVIGLSSLNREHAPLQWIPITHFVYYHHEPTLTTA